MIALTLTSSPSVKVKGAQAPESPWLGWKNVSRVRADIRHAAMIYFAHQAKTRKADAVGLSVVAVLLMKKRLLRPEQAVINYKYVVAMGEAKSR